MNDYMCYLICYDTPNDKRRRKLVQLLSDACERVQWSVFEGWMTTPQLSTLVRRMTRVIDPQGDNVRIYRFCAYCQEEVNVLGVGEQTRLPRYWVV